MCCPGVLRCALLILMSLCTLRQNGNGVGALYTSNDMSMQSLGDNRAGASSDDGSVSKGANGELSRSSRTICRSFPGLTRKQLQQCRRAPDVVASAISGIRISVDECGNQMRDQRWNCSNIRTKNGNPYTNVMMSRGFRETAFAYATISAGVLYQVTRACSMGQLRTCGCDTSFAGDGVDFEWGGCSHDIQFGTSFVETFLDIKERGRDMQSKMNLHNNGVGRIAVAEYAVKKCKCHGMSGSCEVKTCWMQTPHFSEVGDRLLVKFREAKQVVARNSIGGNLRLADDPTPASTDGQRRRRRKRQPVPPKDHLVFLEDSPDFCQADPGLGSLGTRDRYCNRTSDGPEGCDSMCCGRGYNIKLERKTEWCNCKFHWCCQVKCRQCSQSVWVNSCK
ncbi:protein Wnt-10b-like [Patiria miniata]|uniref:Protein Wnt n=1 Tax=Patiria miniata TaxID=46514 RepID=A0A913ZAG7_PATMI|nr:protein Wnt-10b-like [Patiria miniata]